MKKIVMFNNRLFQSILLVLILFNLSCQNDQPKTDSQPSELESSLESQNIFGADFQVNGQVYTNNDLGWEIELPDGYNIQPNQEKSITKGRVLLLNAKKDNKNMCIATFEKRKPSEFKDFASMHENVIKLIRFTYDQNATGYVHSNTHDTVGGNIFVVDRFVLNNPEGQRLLTQELYGCMIQDHYFNFVMNWGDSAEYKSMKDAWENSQFEIALE